MAKPRTPKGRAKESLLRLAQQFPGSAADLCALKFETPFQLLVATILSAQTTDERVNLTTPKLFERFPDAQSLAAADPGEVEVIIQPTGFFRNKTKSIIGMARAVCDDFGGVIPGEMEDLVQLPGVGRKTANVLRSVAMDLPGLPVDTHVMRLTQRLGVTQQSDPVKIEDEVSVMVPSDQWGVFSLRLILHGRQTCVARKPRCGECVLNDFCPSSLMPTRRAKTANIAEALAKPNVEVSD